MYEKDGHTHISQAELQRLKLAKKKSKFGNHVIETPDGRFDSKAEYARFLQLRIQQAGGVIQDLKRQVEFQLTGCKYYADFTYHDNITDQHVVEDVKGVRTRVYIMKRAMMLELHGITIREIKPAKFKRPRRNVRRVI